MFRRGVWTNQVISQQNLLTNQVISQQSIWAKVYRWIGVSVVQPSNLVDHILQHKGLFMGKNRKKRGSYIWHAVIWTLWNERNASIFSNQPIDFLRIVHLIICRSWFWFSAYSDAYFQFFDWCCSPLECVRHS